MIEAKIVIRHTRQYIAYSILLSFFICKSSLYSYIFSVIRRLPLIGRVTDFIILMFLLILFYISFNKRMLHTIKPRDYIVPCFVLLALLFTILIYPENTEYIKYNFNNYIIYCIPAFFVGLCAIDYDDDMFKFVAKVSCVSVIASYLFTLLYVSNSNVVVDELGQSYSVLLSTLIVGSYYTFSKKMSYLVFYMIGIFYALGLGARGPIICILVHSIICFWVSSNKKAVYKIIVALIVLLTVFIFFETELYQNILVSIINILRSKGYSSRVLDLFRAGETFSHTSGRNIIYTRLIELLKQKPLLGYGLFGEWQFINWNAHELYLEVIFEYGIPIGTLLIVWYIYSVVPTFIKDNDSASKLFIAAFIAYVMVQGVMSYSHLRPELFLLLGFCIRQKRINAQYY